MLPLRDAITLYAAITPSLRLPYAMLLLRLLLPPCFRHYASLFRYTRYADAATLTLMLRFAAAYALILPRHAMLVAAMPLLRRCCHSLCRCFLSIIAIFRCRFAIFFRFSPLRRFSFLRRFRFDDIAFAAATLFSRHADASPAHVYTCHDAARALMTTTVNNRMLIFSPLYASSSRCRHREDIT